MLTLTCRCEETKPITRRATINHPPSRPPFLPAVTHSLVTPHSRAVRTARTTDHRRQTTCGVYFPPRGWEWGKGVGGGWGELQLTDRHHGTATCSSSVGLAYTTGPAHHMSHHMLGH